LEEISIFNDFLKEIFIKEIEIFKVTNEFFKDQNEIEIEIKSYLDEDL
jgi:hypothetical protein